MTYNPNQRSDQDSAFLAPEVAGLIDQHVQATSIAAAISTPHRTDRPSVDFPLFKTGVGAQWTAELGEVPLSNADTDSVNVVAYKTIGGTQVSREMISGDMSPDIASLIGTSIGDSIVASLDSAVVHTATVTNGPSGLLGIAGVTDQDTGAASFTLDDLVKAVYTLQTASPRSRLRDLVFLLPVESAQQISLTKIAKTAGAEPVEGVEYNQYLTTFTQDGSLLVAGANIPVLVSPLVAPVTTATTGTAAWLIDKQALRLVTREGTALTRTYIPGNDSYQINGSARYGFGAVNPAAVVRVWNATP